MNMNMNMRRTLLCLLCTPILAACDAELARGRDGLKMDATALANDVTPRPVTDAGQPVSDATVNGACGPADGVPTPAAPTSGLCSAGTPSAVSGSGPWTWSCAGTNGGTTASCSAPKVTPPVAPIDHKCKAGNLPGNVTQFSGGDLHAAMQNLASGGTLVIAAGTYTLTSTVYIDNKHDIVICADPTGGRPKISATKITWEAIKITNSHNIHIEGLELYGNNDKSYPHADGISFDKDAHHVSAWDNWVHDFPGMGIGGGRNLGFIDIRYNMIWNTSNWSTYNKSGISLYALKNGAGGNNADGYANYIIGNTIWNARALVPFTMGGYNKITDGNCIIIDATDGSQTGTAPYTNRTLVANNLCVNNGGRCAHVFASAHVDVVNNTCYKNVTTAPDLTGSGELSANSCDDVVFANNIAVASSNGVAVNTYQATNVSFKNNIYSGNGAAVRGTGDMVTAPGLTNPQQDPRNGDFRVGTGSPSVGAGSASFLAVVPLDLDGNKRPNPPAIGALEP